MRLLIVLVAFFSTLHLSAQTFKSGFDAVEYADLLMLNFKGFSDTSFKQLSNKELRYQYQFTSVTPEVGLANKCAFYLRKDGVGIINLRGTVQKTESWLANFYAGMIPAIDSITLNDGSTFPYQVAANNKSYVHVGWMLSLAHLAPYINHFVDSLRQVGVKQFIVSGHSQGGALAFLTTSYLFYKNHSQGMALKTYASAAPKPGNLYYAYDFEHITRDGWGYRVVNTEDWVPETPLTVQTLNDINTANPISNAKSVLKQQQFLVRLYLNRIYNKMDKASTKTMKHYRTYLGAKVGGYVRKSLPNVVVPNLMYSSNYSTAGTPVILFADDAYHQQFSFTGSNFFVHHMLAPYMYLLQKQYHLP